MLELTTQNLDQIIREMRELTPRLQKRALGQAGRKAMAIVQRAARENLDKQTGPDSTGALRKAIVVRQNARQGRRLGGAMIQVGIRGGAKSYVNSAQNRRSKRVGQTYEQGGNQFYFRFLEFGTRKMRARPFLQPALKDNIQPVTSTMAAELQKAIARLGK